MLGSLQLVRFCIASVQIVSVKFCSHVVVLTIAKVSWLSLYVTKLCKLMFSSRVKRKLVDVRGKTVTVI